MAVIRKAAEVPPGRIIAFDLGGEAVALANAAGQFYAFSDTCTHRGCSLASGDLDGTVVTCDCHGGQYDIRSGEVVGGPPPAGLKTYPVTVAGEDVSIG